MDFVYICGLLLGITAAASFLNYRYLHFPTSVGITLITLLFSIIMILSSALGLDIDNSLFDPLINIDINKTWTTSMISFLLFAGGLQLKARDLAKQKWFISFLTSLGVLVSTIVVGIVLWSIAQMLQIQIGLIYCLLFGALMSPTDPIAVLAVLRNMKVKKGLKEVLAGESLFNDAAGLLLFTFLLELASQGIDFDYKYTLIFTDLFQQVFGAILLGSILGISMVALFKRVDQFPIRVLISLAAVINCNVLATIFNVSGPISVVLAGLILGAQLGKRHSTFPNHTWRPIVDFWSLIDEVLNAVLFVIIGLSIFKLSWGRDAILLAIMAIPTVLLGRLVSVYIPIKIAKIIGKNIDYSVKFLTWAGLRGSLSLVLALSLPDSNVNDQLLMATYAVVVFSILVQGPTLSRQERQRPRRNRPYSIPNQQHHSRNLDDSRAKKIKGGPFKN